MNDKSRSYEINKVLINRNNLRKDTEYFVFFFLHKVYTIKTIITLIKLYRRFFVLRPTFNALFIVQTLPLFRFLFHFALGKCRVGTYPSLPIHPFFSKAPGGLPGASLPILGLLTPLHAPLRPPQCLESILSYKYECFL